mmetsp:Transcript_35747/g.56964  ORF Transcript_35747/g.56964 Transcript_35747/m.56964 type:complete len:310 (-) Transcript_35747:22-951(-)
MPLSQLHIKRAAALEDAAKAGLPGPIEPADLSIRGFIALALVLSAAGGIAVALSAQWWKIWYDDRVLCKANAAVCRLDLEIALNWLCLHTPTDHLCAGDKELVAKFQEEIQAVQIEESAWFLLLAAFALHLPMGICLLVILCAESCARDRQARKCGFRSVACMSALAAVMLLVGLGIVLASVPPNFEFAKRLVGASFGRLAMQQPQLKASVNIGCVVCVAAFGFDLALTLLTFNAGIGATPRSYPGLSNKIVYSPVVCSEEAAAAAEASGRRGPRSGSTPVGRYRQWHVPPCMKKARPFCPTELAFLSV